MKTLNFYALIGIVIASMLLVSCSKEDDQVNPLGNMSSGLSPDDLSEAEQAGLIYLIEKEKLHRDIYLTMSKKCQLPIIPVLRNFDENYMVLLSNTIDRYKLENPIVENGLGEYENSYIKDKYDDFITRCEGSEYGMLLFAKLMEENIIREINVEMVNSFGNEELQKMYSDMFSGSKEQLEIVKNELKQQVERGHPAPGVEEF